MNAKQSAKVAMYRAVKSTVEAHSSVLAGFAPFADAYGQFTSYLAQIGEALTLQETSSKGTTETKADKRAALVADLVKIAAALKYYGATQDNKEVKEAGSVSKSTLDEVGEEPFIGKANLILNTAQANAAGLVPLGITAAFLTGAGTRLAAYVDSVGDPAHVQSEKQRGTSLIVEYMDTIDAILKGRMDPAAELMRQDYVEFVMEYFFSREINDPSYNTRALKVNITDAATGLPLPGVRARILPGDIEKVSSEGGGFYVPHLEGGNYELTLEVPGYKLKTVPFSIVHGQRTELEEKLTKES